MRKDEGAGREGWSEHLRGVSSPVLKAVPLRCREMQSSREKRSCSFHASSHKVKVHLLFGGFSELKPPNKINSHRLYCS